MENINPGPANPERVRVIKSLHDNPGYFGAYLNMARHNIYLILQHIHDSWKEEQTVYKVDELNLFTDPVLSWLINNKIPSRSKYAFERLSDHLPFLTLINDGNQVTANSMLRLLFEKLSNYRDAYSHVYRQETKLHDSGMQNLGQFLQDFFTDAIPLAKKINSVYLGDEAETAFQNLDQGNPQNRYRFLENGTLTEKGLAFFICLFLERKYAHKFLSRLKGFKRTDVKEFKATYLVYEYFCCRLPYPKLESKPGPGATVLDIIGELHKIPDELYHYVSKADKETFMPPVATPDEEKEEDGFEAPPPVMKRFEDRFYYLAMRAIDETDLMGNLRFQVGLGKKIIQKKEPKIILGQQRPRTITQPLNIFQKLSKLADVVNLKPHWLHDTESGKKVSPNLIEQYSPHYNLENNTIAIGPESTDIEGAIGARNTKAKLKQPFAFISQYDIPQLAMYCLLHSQGSIPTSLQDYLATLSNSLKQLAKDISDGSLLPVVETTNWKRRLHVNHPKEAKAYTAENFEILYQHTQELNEVLQEKYHLSTGVLLDNIREYLLGYKPPELKYKINDFFTRLHKENEEYIEKLERLPVGVKPKFGEYATWLASDMLQMSPPEIREHVRDFHYRELQGSLAYFSNNKEAVDTLVKELFIGAHSSHYFINRINITNCTGLLHFYKCYLHERQNFVEWLQKEWNDIRKQKRNFDQFLKNWGHLCSISEIDIEKQKKQSWPSTSLNAILNMPLVVPRAYFNEPIIKALAQQNNTIDTGKHNFVKALEIYLHENKQGFYNLERHYQLSEKYIISGSSGQDFEDVYQAFKENRGEAERGIQNRNNRYNKKQKKVFDPTEEPSDRSLFFRFKNKIAANEQAIRYKATQDRVLYLLAQELVKNHNTDAFSFEGFTLDQINGYSSDFINRLIDLEFTINDASIKLKTTIKRSGETRRYVKDRRMPELLKYLKVENLTVEIIQSELEDYDNMREMMGEQILNFEKALQPILKEWTTEKLKTEKLVNFISILDYLKENFIDGALSENEITILREIRNKFSHNEYYFIEGLQLNGRKVATALYNTFEELTNKILVHLKLDTNDRTIESLINDVGVLV